MTATSGPKKYPHLSAIGGAIAMICFFMPWVGCPMGNLSGSDIGGALWLVPFAAAGIVGAYFYFSSKGQPALARKPILWSAAGAIGLMLIQWLRFLSSENSELLKLRFGAFGTLLGFGLALYGTKQLPEGTGSSDDT